MEDVNISKYRASVVRDGSKPASPGFVVSEGQDPVNPPGTNNYVPYSGATANVELGEYGVESGFITLDTTPTNTPVDQGTIYWDDTRSTAALIMNGTLQHIGQDSFFYVKNSSGSTIPKGTCVRFAGTDGASGHLLVTPFLANGSVPSTYFMGVTAEAITNGSFGQVMHFGELEGINTSGFTAGALLYASTTVAGGFQTTVPVAPNNIVLVAAAVNSKNNGAIVVRPTYGSNINIDEGVKITSPTTGDLLQLQAGGLWENKTIDGAGIVTKATSQVISGLKTFNVNTLMMQSSGNANAVYLSNSSGSSTYQSGFNFFGFNTDNHIYFSKSSITGGNTGILAWSNTATRTYTLKDASGTLAFTSDIPANPVGGTGTTNYLPKFTGSTTIGNSQIFDNGTNVSIGATSTNGKLTVVSNPASWNNFANAQLRLGATISGNSISMLFTDGNNSNGWFGYQDNAVSANRYFYWSANDGVSQQMQLNSSGNLGLGVTPNTWTGTGVKAFQFQNGSLAASNTFGALFGWNTYYEGTYKYVSNTTASAFLAAGNDFIWYQAPSGTAGNAISFTQAMTLTSGGNLLVGTTTDNGARLQVNGTATFTKSAGVGNVASFSDNTYGLDIATTSTGGSLQTYNTNQTLDLKTYGTGTINLFTSNTPRMTITSGGNVGIANTSPSYIFDVIARASGEGGVRFWNNRANTGTIDSIALNLHVSNSVGQTGGKIVVAENTTDSWPTNMQFWVNGASSSYSPTQAMTITSSGNLIINPVGAYNQSLLTVKAATTDGKQIHIVQSNDDRGWRFSARTDGHFYLASTFNGSDSNVLNARYDTGNVLIGTTTDNGAKLQVNGDILTSAPSGGTAGKWKLGTATSGSYTIGGKIRIEINGVAYDILTT